MNNFSPSHGNGTKHTRYSLSSYYYADYNNSHAKSSQRQQIREMIESVLIPITLFILGLTIKNTRDIGKLCGKLNNEKA